MGGTDFEFGHNVRDNADPWGRSTGPDGTRRKASRSGDALTQSPDTDTGPVSEDCWKDTNCQCASCQWQNINVAKILEMANNITETVRKANRTESNMDLGNYRSSKNGRPKFENRDWLDSQKDLPKKGSSKWKIDAVREAKKGTKGIVAFVDLSNGSKKRVMSLRKGFTLDAFLDELGTKTEKWIGKSISLERGGSEGQYVNVAQ